MKATPLLLIFCVNCLLYVSHAVDPACECVMYESNGRSQGTFNSPNFPEIYPPGINCILFTFIGELDEIIELSFLEFDLQVPITNKCTDFVKFFLDLERPEVNEHSEWNYELCGNVSMIQKNHYSSGRALILEFHTDSVQANNTGFRGIFKFLDKSQFEIHGDSKRFGGECLYEFASKPNSQSGAFFSPRYPQNYPPDANCQYIFKAGEKERVKVTFRNIQLEYIDGSCSDSTDSIVVRDGVDSVAPVIALYCNTLNGEHVISSGRQLYIEFMVDDRKQSQGFAAIFEFIEGQPRPKNGVVIDNKHPDNGGRGNTHNPGDDPIIGHSSSTAATIIGSPSDCVHEFVSSAGKNGTFSSPHYPEPYPSHTTCRYIFTGQGRERVQIIFTDLDLAYDMGDPQQPHECDNVDAIAVSVRIGGEMREIVVNCGRKKPDILMSNNNNLEVTFVSRSREPSATRAKGFMAKYNFVTDFGIKSGQQETDMVCGFVYRSNVATNGTFTSPNYPGLYPRNTECHYLFYGLDNEKVHITFPYFDVEGIPVQCSESTQSDYIEFSNFNVHLKDRQMKRYCGSREAKERVHSDGPFFRVTFKSNEIYDATGFEAFYQFKKESDTDNHPGPPDKRVRNTGSTAVASITATLSIIAAPTVLAILWRMLFL